MKKTLVAFVVSAGVSAGVGIYFWKQGEKTKRVWSSATDSLESSTGNK